MSIFLRNLGVFLLMMAAFLTLVRRETPSVWITFESDREGYPAIYLMSEDGAFVRRLTQEGTCYQRPRPSPDGRWIAFDEGCGSEAVLRMPFRGGIPQTITTALRYDWSPDGEQLVVERTDDAVYIVDADGGNERLLAIAYSSPRWSPDGKWIYARPDIIENTGLVRIHVETGAIEPLLPLDALFTDFGWSPDGAQFVFTMWTDAGDRLFIITLDSGDIEMIPVDLPEPRAYGPRWSPDGAWIAYLGNEPPWSPDGAWIAYLGNEPPWSMSIFRVRPDGSDLEILRDGLFNPSELHWSPNGEWLLFSADIDGHNDIFRLGADSSSLEGLTWDLDYDGLPHYVTVSGFDWHPLWLTLAALGLIFVSLMGRFRL
jgi:Tol biopolymer transport system component